MREPISKEDQVLIASNLITCATIDIEFMTKRSYDFISNRNGFSKHNDREGFIAAYKRPIDLACDILDLQNYNQFEKIQVQGQTDVDYEYYMSVRAVYNAIVEGILENVPHTKRDN